MSKRINRRSFTEKERQRIFKASNGVCHLCKKPVALDQYNNHDHDRGWHVDHSRPIANGGTHHPNNLRAAHIKCNRDKSDIPAGEFRAKVKEQQAEYNRRLWGQATLAGVAGIILIALLGRK